MSGQNNNFLVKRISIFLGILVIIGSAVAGYTEVKIQSKQNKEDLKELKNKTAEDIKEIRKDQTTMLIQQTKILAILER